MPDVTSDQTPKDSRDSHDEQSSEIEPPLSEQPLDQDESEFSPSAVLKRHPMAQKIRSENLQAPLTVWSLLVVCSVLRWMRDGPDIWAARGDWIFEQGEYWRLLTSIFVHADAVHLLSNSSLFLIFAVLLRQYFGLWAFPVISTLGGILTMGCSVLTYDQDVKLLGASGMVYCMTGLWLVLFARYADYLSYTHRAMRILGFVLVVLMPSQIDPQVSYRTHAIGFGLGLLIASLFSRWLQPRPIRPEDQEPTQREHVTTLH